MSTLGGGAGALLPCPFCGGPAETDYNRQFYDYRGQPGRAVAIYCVSNDPVCHCDMTLCCDDIPNWSVDEMMAHLADAWNRRAPSAAAPLPMHEEAMA